MHDRHGHGVLLLGRGNPWLLCAFDIRGDEVVCAFHFSHVIAKWSRPRIPHSSEASPSPFSHKVFARAQNTADG
jgi:hypothetical protein